MQGEKSVNCYKKKSENSKPLQREKSAICYKKQSEKTQNPYKEKNQSLVIKNKVKKPKILTKRKNDFLA